MSVIRLKIIVEEIEDKEKLQAEVKQLEHRLEAKYPGIENLDLSYQSNGALHISSVKVHIGRRGEGVGTAVMEEIIKFADDKGLVITLNPEPEWGYKKKLIQWYKGHGFTHNKGRKKDYRYSSLFAPSMIRRPK